MKVIEVQWHPMPTTKPIATKPAKRHNSKFIAMCLGVFAVAAVGAWAMNYDPPQPLRPVMEYEVVEGDTLWDIASTYGPEHADVRETYYQIMQDNHIPDGKLQPGQTVYIKR